MQEAIRSVFRRFLAIGSVRQTLLWFLEHGLQLPACTPRGEVHWKRPSYGTVHQILTNPVYGGAYAYGKTECTVHYEAGEPRKRDRRKPRDQWLALIPNAHDGYVEWNEFERIQGAIHANVRMGAHAGAPKNGEALVTGLLRCRRCANKLTVHYTGSRHDALRYSCHRAWLDKGLPRCIAFGGTRVDAAIAQAVLRVVQPAAIEAAIVAREEEIHKHDEVLPHCSVICRQPDTPRNVRRNSMTLPIRRTGSLPTSWSADGMMRCCVWKNWNRALSSARTHLARYRLFNPTSSTTLPQRSS
ncbi:recombinase family protein [Paraburkholderia aromaticivorans]|uniref:recombinase family protein n=1 Tax=Paraburkholderia aromaticivorans TaxID=2026199 RepID=UPI0014560C6F|nr:recombinase family protein [Paraburkholderia aromaticivorans]